MKTFLTFFLCLISLNVLAKLPPLTQAQLDALSNTVVKARVLKSEATGPEEVMGCTQRTPYTVTLKVSQILKGEPLKNNQFIYTQISLKEKCTGPSSNFYFPGDKGIFYLKCDDAACGLIGFRDENGL